MSAKGEVQKKSGAQRRQEKKAAAKARMSLKTATLTVGNATLTPTTHAKLARIAQPRSPSEQKMQQNSQATNNAADLEDPHFVWKR